MGQRQFTSSARRAIVFTAGLLLIAATAQANDRKIYPATVCQVWSGDAASGNYVQYSVWGRIMNTHPTKALTVVCPVPRDNTSAAAEWVRVSYWDQNPIGGSTGQVRCRVRSNSVYGNLSVSDSPEASTNASGGSYSGIWNFWGLPAAGGDYPNTYTLTCVLPPSYNGNASSIGAIIVEEP
jgi:hypothetical protein